MADADFYKQSPAIVAEATKRAAELEEELMHCLERWEELG